MMMNNNVYNKKKNKKGNNIETSTLPITSIDGTTINSTNNMEANPQYYELYKKVIELESENKQLAIQVKNICSNVSSIRKKENRLLNRFGWTLIMANILLGVLSGVVVLGYFQFFYPTLQKNINSDGTLELIKWGMFGILGILAAIWFSVMKFANYIRKRDQVDKDEF